MVKAEPAIPERDARGLAQRPTPDFSIGIDGTPDAQWQFDLDDRNMDSWQRARRSTSGLRCLTFSDHHTGSGRQ